MILRKPRIRHFIFFSIYHVSFNSRKMYILNGKRVNLYILEFVFSNTTCICMCPYVVSTFLYERRQDQCKFYVRMLDMVPNPDKYLVVYSKTKKIAHFPYIFFITMFQNLYFAFVIKNMGCII